jgi:hypothetical protein
MPPKVKFPFGFIFSPFLAHSPGLFLLLLWLNVWMLLLVQLRIALHPLGKPICTQQKQKNEERRTRSVDSSNRIL